MYKRQETHSLNRGNVKKVLVASETCPIAENEANPHESTQPGGSSSNARALIQLEDKATPLGNAVPELERYPFLSEVNTSPSLLPTSLCYNKLPHPAEKIIPGLPKANGFCMDTLLEFFKIAMRLKRCLPASEAGFLALLMPYCCGALGDRLAKHPAADNFDGFHQEALEFLIPDRLFSSLK